MNIIKTRPGLFQKSASCIWTSPYIQQNLLDAHLNPSSDGASRNIESVHTTVDFINDQIPESSHILDLGCGPGIYTELLAEKGHRVTGIDFNRKAIEYAQQQNINKKLNVEYIEGDYIRNFPYGKYDAIILIYCDLGTHSDEERDILLKNCYDSLAENGVLIFDVFDENLILDKKEEKGWEYCQEGGFWSEDPYLLLNETFHYPEDQVFAYQYNLIHADQVDHFIIWERYYNQQEIKEILEEIGFREVNVRKGLLKGNNFTSGNEMFMVGRI